MEIISSLVEEASYYLSWAPYLLITISIFLIISIPFFKDGKNKSFLINSFVINLIVGIGAITGFLNLILFFDLGELYVFLELFIVVIIFLFLPVPYLYFKKILNKKIYGKLIFLFALYAISVILITIITTIGIGALCGNDEACGYAAFGGLILGPLIAILINSLISGLFYKYFFRKEIETQPIQNSISGPIQINKPNPVSRNKLPRWIVGEIILILCILLSISIIFIRPLLYEITHPPVINKIEDAQITSTKGWKTFEGKFVGISFLYPSTWSEVDSKYVSRIPVHSPESGESYLEEGKNSDLISVDKIPKSDPDYEYRKLLFNRLEKIKTGEQIKDEEFEEKLLKLAQGKTKTNEPYIIYQEASSPQDGYSNNYISMLIKSENYFYLLSLTNFNKEGSDVFYSMVPTISINSNFDENGKRSFSNSVYSLEYPQDLEYDKETSSFGPIEVTDETADLGYYQNDKYKTFPWWQGEFCSVFDEYDTNTTFTHINGYPVITKDAKINGTGGNESFIYFFNEPNVILLKKGIFDYSKNGSKILNIIAQSLKFKKINNSPKGISIPPDNSPVNPSTFNCNEANKVLNYGSKIRYEN